MKSLEDSFKAAMNLFPVLVFVGMRDMLKPILASEIEAKLGRKLTDQEWYFYLRENYRKAEVDSRQRVTGQWEQRLADMKVIRDFVWGENLGNS